jgi:hypothetical protein
MPCRQRVVTAHQSCRQVDKSSERPVGRSGDRSSRGWVASAHCAAPRFEGLSFVSCEKKRDYGPSGWGGDPKAHAKSAAWERVRVGIKQCDVADLLTLYGIADSQQRARFLALTQQATASDWWHQHSDVLPS